MVEHLSKDLKVACEIWHYNQKKEPVYFSKLIESLAWCMNKHDISYSLDTLTDWMIIYGEYGSCGNGCASYLLYIDTWDDGDFRIRDLYEKYWKNERKEKV